MSATSPIPQDLSPPQPNAPNGSVSYNERLVVAPCDGRFAAAPSQHYTAEGEYVLEGQEVAAVTSTNGERIAVLTKFSGWVMGYLVRDGEPVRESQPILWLRRL